MSTGADRLRELVEHTVRASNPEAALRALAALRTELQEVERAEAARALANGSSFGAIARALGVSRQSAHRRYRDLSGAEPPPEPEPKGRMLVTSEARAAVRHAREEASALGAGAVGSEHLLLGVMRCSRAAVTHVLHDLGVDLEAARQHALPTMEAEAAHDTGATVPPGPKGISAYAKRVFEQSLIEATSRGDGYVGVEHLVLAALGDPDGGAVRTLDALGISRDTVRDRIERRGTMAGPP
jgi:hypothetical protein